MMTPDQITLVLILTLSFVLFMSGRIRYDIVALASLLLGVVFGIIPHESAYKGFGSDATVMVTFVFLLGRALSISGTGELLGKFLRPLMKTRMSLILVLCFTGCILSAFINNVGALVFLMPFAINAAREVKEPTGMVLMPLSFSCILGGLITGIGTPPNIIISSYRTNTFGEAFHIFDFTYVGGGVALGGVLFVAFIGWRLISKSKRKTNAPNELLDIKTYIAEAKVSKGSKLIDASLTEIEELAEENDIVIAGLVRNEHVYAPLPQHQTLRENDILILEADPEGLSHFISLYKMNHIDNKGKVAKLFESKNSGLMEVVITPQSTLEKQKIQDIKIKKNFGLNLLGISREGASHRGRLSNFKLAAGDILLLQGEWDHMTKAIQEWGVLALAEKALSLSKSGKMPLCLLIFLGAILAPTFGVFSLPISLGIAVILLILFKILPLRDLYRHIEWPVIFLIAAMIPLGEAIETTGLAHRLSALLLTQNISPQLSLFLLFIITMFVSDILNNTATTVLMAPIAASLAGLYGVSADPFLMSVAVGASCAFLTPIGHQNNILILGPGGYSFGDFWKVGLPLQVVIVLLAYPLIIFFWPF